MSIGSFKFSFKSNTTRNVKDSYQVSDNWKEIEAICFAYDPGKCANSILRKMSHSAFATEESNKLELNALKSIVTCVETRNLEHKFTIDTLKKRILELENASPARKKIPASMKPSTKRTPHDNHPNPSPVKSVPTPTLQVSQWSPDQKMEKGRRRQKE
ncbi:hypothetical protein HPP92_019623 [Vanilla planifolia]|uniref:FRIGIDA-like protein n=1 Tax=Vanilla planifolia TaxID=51239 RepID=A0A835UJH5_VANPL|nr:hypothetical protein HPP92_019623 [Vanilla planifolia]